MPVLPLTAVFDDLPDPRRDTANKLHALTDLLVTSVNATEEAQAGSEVERHLLREDAGSRGRLRSGPPNDAS